MRYGNPGSASDQQVCSAFGVGILSTRGDEFIRSVWSRCGTFSHSEEQTMGKLVVNTFTSLDGVIQSPGMPEEDREGGFDKGGWQVPYFDQESGQVMGEAMAAFDAL